MRWYERVYFGAVAVASSASLCLMAAAHGLPGPRFNPTPSVPVGLYWYTPGPVQRGDIVQACLPAQIAQYALSHAILERGICPRGVEPVVKVLAAVTGDVVSISPDRVTINGKVWPMSALRRFDSLGGRVTLHAPFGTSVVQPGDVLLLGLHPRSFDGRYFGPLKVSLVSGRYHPLLTERGSNSQ